MGTDKISRREFSRSALKTFTAVALLETLFVSCSSDTGLKISKTDPVIESKAAEILNHWAVDLNEICGDLKSSRIGQRRWQEEIEKLFGRIELSELLEFIDFEKLTRRFEFPDLGVNTRPVNFPKIKELPAKTVFIKKIFGMSQGRAIIPHGHSNMASAHLVLKGGFELRHFEKIRSEKNHLIVRPTIDKAISKGNFSSISDEKDNVHWFIATSGPAFTFDVIMTDLNGKKYDIHNIDISDGEKLSDGAIRAKKLDVKTALKKYGKDHHGPTPTTP